jgi:hypothetical protein
MTGMEICRSCDAYTPGKSICEHGFPRPFGKIPMCLRDDFSEAEWKRFFREDGFPLLARRSDEILCH